MPISLMVNMNNLDASTVALMHKRGLNTWRHPEPKQESRVSIDTTLAALADEQARKHREVFQGVAKNLGLPTFAGAGTRPESPAISEVARAVAQNLGLSITAFASKPLPDDGAMPSSTGDSGLPEASRQRSAGRWSDGGGGDRLPKGSKDPAKYRSDPFAPAEPLSAAAKRIYKNLGLQVMDDADGAESEDTVYARLGLSKGGKRK